MSVDDLKAPKNSDPAGFTGLMSDLASHQCTSLRM